MQHSYNLKVETSNCMARKNEGRGKGGSLAPLSSCELYAESGDAAGGNRGLSQYCFRRAWDRGYVSQLNLIPFAGSLRRRGGVSQDVKSDCE